MAVIRRVPAPWFVRKTEESAAVRTGIKGTSVTPARSEYFVDFSKFKNLINILPSGLFLAIVRCSDIAVF